MPSVSSFTTYKIERAPPTSLTLSGAISPKGHTASTYRGGALPSTILLQVSIEYGQSTASFIALVWGTVVLLFLVLSGFSCCCHLTPLYRRLTTLYRHRMETSILRLRLWRRTITRECPKEMSINGLNVSNVSTLLSMPITIGRNK